MHFNCLFCYNIGMHANKIVFARTCISKLSNWIHVRKHLYDYWARRANISSKKACYELTGDLACDTIYSERQISQTKPKSFKQTFVSNKITTAERVYLIKLLCLLKGVLRTSFKDTFTLIYKKFLHGKSSNNWITWAITRRTKASDSSFHRCMNNWWSKYINGLKSPVDVFFR